MQAYLQDILQQIQISLHLTDNFTIKHRWGFWTQHNTKNKSKFPFNQFTKNL